MPFAGGGGPGKPLREQTTAELWRAVGFLHVFATWPLSFLVVATYWGGVFSLPARIAALAAGAFWASLFVGASLVPFGELRRRGEGQWDRFGATVVLGVMLGAVLSAVLLAIGT